jgi:trigger factor
MKIRKQERDKNWVTLEIEAGADQFKDSIEKTIQKASRSVRVPGFREGKAPRHLVEKQLDMQFVQDQAVQDLISDLYPEILKQSGIKPVDYPGVEVLEIGDKGVVFRIKVETYPEVKLGKYKGLKVERKSAEVTEEEVLRLLGDLQNRFAKYVDVADRGIGQEDLVALDMKATCEGKKFAPLTRNNVSVVVGKGVVTPEFDREILGLRVGEEKSFEITFPKDYPIQDVAEKNAGIEVKVNSIKKKEVEDLSDDFVKKVSRSSNLAEFKEELRTNLTKEKELAVEGEVKDQLIEKLAAETAVDVPQALVNRESELMLEDFERSLSQQGLTLEAFLKSTKKTRDDLKEEMKDSAAARAKAKLVLLAVAEKEKLEISQAEIDREIEHFAQERGKSFEDMKATLPEGVLDYIDDYLKRQKALDFVKSNAKITETKEIKKIL